MTQPIILIPARLAASRLPNKPLADIAGQPMIVHCWQRAMQSKVGRVVVAAGDQAIVDAVTKAGGEAILTDPNLPTGSDRIYQALLQVDRENKHPIIINLQGDVPTLSPDYVAVAGKLLDNPATDIGTLIAPITTEADLKAPQIVKAIVEMKPGERTGQAFYFTRNPAPANDGPHYVHIGIYAYRRAALEKFVKSPQGVLEKRESLEQLRALALGMRIDAALVDEVPVGVDTPADLELVRAQLAGK